MTIKHADRRVLARNSPAEDVQVARTRGSYLYDASGRRYIDFHPGWCVGNFGWGRPEIEAAIRRSRRADYVTPDFLYAPWVELAELLAAITPGRLKRSFRAVGGTEAVEIALQVAMSATGRHKFLSIEDSYHGNSIGALSIGASETRERLKNLLPNCFKISAPLDEAAAAKAETRLKRRDIAAFIMEPIVCNLGVLVPEPAFMSRMQALCRKYGTLLIMDEVATGFGRTGKLFGSMHFDIEPDIMCLAKAITGGYAPMAATIVTEAVARSLDDDFSFYSTYGWHPVSVAASLAAIKFLVKHEKELLAGVEELSEYFQVRLSSLDFGQPVRIRIKGLAIAIECAEDGAAERLREKCRRKGLLVSVEDEYLMLLPALTMDRRTAQRGLDILQSCVEGT
jgi:adenosylmethionine-8-amino-7-oxononanoate aminotransferase